MTRRVFWSTLALMACAPPESGAPGAPASARSAAGPSAESPAVAARCEHGLAPAICTKCNPKLAPVFQAKGDWCAEHGFPESFCPICHPERGGQPAVDVTSDGVPAEGTKVRLKSADDARIAGIQTVAAVARPGGARLSAAATLVFDATRRAEVNVRSPGVLRNVLVDVGARVRAGEALATVESAAVSADQGRRVAAESRLRLAESTHERESGLFAAGATSRRDLQAAASELDAARADVAAVRAGLLMLGPTQTTGRSTLTSPLAGTVLRRNATVGRLVGPDEVLFEIVDTGTLWAEIDLPERQAGRVQVGQSVTLTVDMGDGPTNDAVAGGDAAAGAPAEGRIQFVAPEVDPRTRTVRARATVGNPDGHLRAHMFARAEIALGEASGSVLVPRTALQQAKGVDFVFVRTGAQDFEVRRVRLGAPMPDPKDDRREVLSGLRPGDDVATTGSFLLKTETLKGSIGAGCCDE